MRVLPKLKNFRSKLASQFARLNYRQRMVVFVVIFAIIGSIFLLAVRAVSPNAALEPESGNIIGPAIACNDTNASDNGCVQFKTASTGAPTGPPAGTRLCNGGADAATYLTSKYLTVPTVSTINADPEFSGYAITSVVDLPAADNSAVIGQNFLLQPHTFYYFEPGVHYVGTFTLDQTTRLNHMIFYGGGTAANPAIIDAKAYGHSTGRQYASVGQVSNVMFEYLTIRNYSPPSDQFIMNHDSADNWVEKYNTIGPNPDGAGSGMGQNAVIKYNCFTNNGQYALNGYSANCTTQIPGGGCKVFNVTIDHNEFDTNNVKTFNSGPAVSQTQNGWSTGSNGAGCPQCGYDNYPTPGGPLYSDSHYNNGFSGAMKLWIEQNTDVTNNWIHDTHSVAIWADTINIGINISGNYFNDNWGEAIEYEVSYNAQITNNTMVNNDWVLGARNPGFPQPAIYMSESGYDSRVSPNNGSGFTAISGNIFTDNWDGVALWENPARFCSNGLPTSQCTEPESGQNPQATLTSCKNPGTATNAPLTGLLADCRWRTQNIHVKNNTFNFNPANINPRSLAQYAAPTGCSGNYCGYNSIISNNSHNSAGEPFWPSDILPHSITWDQGNQFINNDYIGPWKFDTNEAGGAAPVKWSEWIQTVGTRGGDLVNTEYHPAQDAGGTCYTTSAKTTVCP